MRVLRGPGKGASSTADGRVRRSEDARVSRVDSLRVEIDAASGLLMEAGLIRGMLSRETAGERRPGKAKQPDEWQPPSDAPFHRRRWQRFAGWQLFRPGALRQNDCRFPV